MVFEYSLSLEWNNVGQSQQGIECLCSALGVNKSLLHLDLRNNRIVPSAGPSLGNMLALHRTLQVLDLRWNDLGTEGAKSLLGPLEKNRGLIELDLAGNKVSEEVLNAIGIQKQGYLLDEFIEKNKAENEVRAEHIPEDHGPTQSRPRLGLEIGLNLPLEKPKERLPREDRESADLQSRYEAQQLAHEKTARRLEEAEGLLEQEREKNAQLRQELLKSIELEKEVEPILDLLTAQSTTPDCHASDEGGIVKGRSRQHRSDPGPRGCHRHNTERNLGAHSTSSNLLTTPSVTTLF